MFKFFPIISKKIDRLSFSLFVFAFYFVSARSVSADWLKGLLDSGLYSGLPTSRVENVIAVVMQWILSLVGIVAVAAFAISGLMYLTSAGDEDQAKRAKKALIYSVIGVIVALSGLIILGAIDRALRGHADF